MEKKILKVSIITVCYNCEKTIEGTIQSVLMQDYNNIDYLFIDGASNDGTLEIIKDYAKNYPRIKYISEKDKGIYDAMNKGISNAEGEVLFFLNSGDEFYDDKVISDIAAKFEESDLDIIYGDVVKRNEKHYFLEKQNKIDLEYLLNGKMICHQSIFARKSIFNTVGNFNTYYKISADYEWLIRAFIKGLKTDYYSRIIAFYDTDGISAQNESRKKIWKEREEIIYSNFGFSKYLFLFFNQRVLRRIKRKLRLSGKG